jgi:hypothetical protein
MPIVLRQTKGTPLTVAEVDGNFTYLSSNSNLKANIASPTFTGTVTLPNSLVQVTASTYPTIRLNYGFS